MIVGDRIRLLYEMVGSQNEVLPIDTLGTLIGLANGVPQVDFGCYGIKMVPPHAVELIDLPDGALLPEDGERLGSHPLVAIVAALSKENAALRRQLMGTYTPAVWRQ